MPLVGRSASRPPSRPSSTLPTFLGEPVARSLSEVEGSVDVVEVFRPAAEAPQIAREAIKVGAKVLWLQLGIESQEAEQVAEAAGLTVVMDRCMGETHGELGLGLGPG